MVAKRLGWCLWFVSLSVVSGCADDAADRGAGPGGSAGAPLAGAAGQGVTAGAAGGGTAGASAGAAGGGSAGAAGQAAGGTAGAQGGSSGGSGGKAGAAPTWSTVYTTSFGVCVGCHGSESKNGVRPDLSSEEVGYASITTTTSTYCFLGKAGAMPYVTPGKPDQSAIYQVVTEGLGCTVSQMPKNLAPLSDEKIELIRAWIQAGAPP